MAEQFRQLRKMGDIKGLMGMIPGVAKMKDKIAAANIDDKTIARQEAIILSMTLKERKNPKLLNGSRRRRIAGGSGTSVQDVNRVTQAVQADVIDDEKSRQDGQKRPHGGGHAAGHDAARRTTDTLTGR